MSGGTVTVQSCWRRQYGLRSGGSIGGSVFGGDDADKVSISGTAVVGIAVEETDSVFLGDGDDTFEMSGGELEGDVSGGDDNNTMTISGGRSATASSGRRRRTVTVSGGSILGSAIGGVGNDTLNFSGGTVGFDVVGLDGEIHHRFRWRHWWFGVRRWR